jgi:hypothetical protein
MLSFRQLPHDPFLRKMTMWIGIGFIVIEATGIYYVQEMIAALIIFSALFLVMAMLALIVFLLDRASERLTAWAEAALARAGRWFLCVLEDVIPWPVSSRAASYRLTLRNCVGRSWRPVDSKLVRRGSDNLGR